MNKLIVICFILTVFFCCKEKQQQTLKQREVFLYDKVGLLTKEQFKLIDESLREFEKETTSEILIFVSPSIPEQYKNAFYYSVELSNELQVGKEGINNGVLIFLSLKEKALEIRLGYGFEWAMKQSQVDSIATKMLTFFRSAQFYEGLRNGIDSIKESAKTIKWNICNENENLECVQTFKIKRLAEKDEDFIIVETENSRKLKLYVTKYMSSLIDRIEEKPHDAIVYCRSTAISGEAYLLGVIGQ